MAATRNTRPSAANAMRWKMHSGHGSRPQANWEKIAKPISATQIAKPAKPCWRNDQPNGFRRINRLARNGRPGNKNPGEWPGFLQSGRLRQLLRRDFRPVDELDIGHRCIVAVAEAALDDAQVAARTFAVTRAQVDEQLAHGFLVAQAREGQAAV